MAYVYLAIAILFEILGTVSMKYSEGFTKVLPSVLIVVSYGICFVCLTVALKTLPVSLVYSLWAGVGTAIMAVVGLFVFNEPLPLLKVFATSLIVLGVLILNFSDSQSSQDKEQVADAQQNIHKLERVPASPHYDYEPMEKVPESNLFERNSG